MKAKASPASPFPSGGGLGWFSNGYRGSFASSAVALSHAVGPRGGSDRQRQLHQLLLLLVVERFVAGGRRRGRVAAGVDQLLMRQHVALEVVLDAVPRALVAGFLLAP